MYYFLLVTGIFLSVINDKKKISFYLFTGLISGLSFFRYGVGADYFSYEYLFNRFNSSPVEELLHPLDKQEIGFRLIGSVLKEIGVSYEGFLVLFSLISFVFLIKVCLRYCKNPTLAMTIMYSFYYFVWIFSSIRQGISLCIGMYFLLRSIETKKGIKIIFVSLLLSAIHLSALIFIPLYYASRFKLAKINLIYFSIICIAISVIPFSSILSHFNWIPVVSRITQYAEPNSLATLFEFKSIGRLLFLGVAFYLYEPYSEQNEFSNRIINLYIIGIGIYFLFKSFELTAARLSVYGNILDIIILSNSYYLCKDRANKLFYACILSGLIAVYFLKNLNAMETNSKFSQRNHSRFVPYSNVFNKDQYIFEDRQFWLGY